MAQPFDVSIRGAGIVGHTLALHLAHQGFRVALAHSAHAPLHASDVRAYALNQTSKKLLDAICCWPDPCHATPVQTMDIYGDAGGHVTFHASNHATTALNWIVDVPALEKKLAQAISFQPLIQTNTVAAQAPLTIVCEGKASTSRAEFGVEFSVIPYAQWALATRIECALPHAQIARQWFGEKDILAFLPLDGSEGKHCAIVWSVPPARAQELKDMNEADFCAALSHASKNTLGTVQLTAARHIWPLQQACANHWSGTSPQGSWLLAGDAAHNVHPLAGQGLNLGLGDVAEITHILATKPQWCALNDPKLLRQYERARKTSYYRIGQAGDSLQQLFSHPQPAIKTLRNWGMRAFDRSQHLKHWVAHHAMGTSASAPL